MAEKFILNKKYILRKGIDDQYIMYDKTTRNQYQLSFKLFYILNLFRNSSLSINRLEEDLKLKGVDMSDFFELLTGTTFHDLLVRHDDSFCLPDYYSEKRMLSPFTEYSPARMDFLITKYCNLACKHCFEGASSKLKGSLYNVKDIIKVFQELDKSNLQTLKITGGEPFSVPNFDEILSVAGECRFETIVLTNAMLIESKHIDILKKWKIQLGISLDGINDQAHDFIRGKGAFNIVYPQLIKLKEAGVNFSITCSINRHNFNQIADMIPFVLDHLGADTLFLNRLRAMGRAVHNGNMFISEQENQSIIALYHSLKDVYGMRLALSDDSVEKSSGGNIIRCAAGNSIIAMDGNFDIYPCVYAMDHKDYVMGNLLESGIDDIWSSSAWDKFRGKTTLEDLEDCRSCQLKTVCAIKNCRLKPVYEGRSFTSSVSYCRKNI